MKLKKEFNMVAMDMQHAAMNAVMNEFRYNQYFSGTHQNPMEAFSNAIARAVGQAVYQSMLTLQANQYTDEDFENDIGLKP